MAYYLFTQQLHICMPGLTLSQREGERAMLIKNGKGDWGIVKAHWIGFRRGIPKSDRGGYIYYVMLLYTGLSEMVYII